MLYSGNKIVTDGQRFTLIPVCLCVILYCRSTDFLFVSSPSQVAISLTNTSSSSARLMRGSWTKGGLWSSYDPRLLDSWDVTAAPPRQWALWCSSAVGPTPLTWAQNEAQRLLSCLLTAEGDVQRCPLSWRCTCSSFWGVQIFSQPPTWGQCKPDPVVRAQPRSNAAALSALGGAFNAYIYP